MSLIHEKLGINQLTTASYRPQGNAIAERVNKTVVGILAMFVSEHQKDWDYLLPFAIYTYNTAMHDGIEESPYVIMYARNPKLPKLEGFELVDRRIDSVDVKDYGDSQKLL